MMNKKILMTGAFITLLSAFISGCAAVPNENTPAPVNSNQPTETSGSKLLQPDQETPILNQTQDTEKTMEVISSADKTLNAAALNYKDESYCDKISLQDFMAKCKDDVRKSIILETAIKDLDPKICEGLGNQSDIEGCQTQVEVAKTEKLKADQRNAALDSNENLIIQAVDKNDRSICQKITDDNQKQLCSDKLYTREAVVKNDKTICEKIVNSDEKRNCLLNFGPQ